MTARSLRELIDTVGDAGEMVSAHLGPETGPGEDSDGVCCTWRAHCLALS